MRGSLSLFRLLSLRPSPLVSALPRANPPSLFLPDSLSLSLALVLIHYLSLLILLSRILRHSHSRGITVRVFVIARLSRSRGSCPPPPCHFLLVNPPCLSFSLSRFPVLLARISFFHVRSCRSTPVHHRYTPPPASSHPLSPSFLFSRRLALPDRLDSSLFRSSVSLRLSLPPPSTSPDQPPRVAARRRAHARGISLSRPT